MSSSTSQRPSSRRPITKTADRTAQKSQSKRVATGTATSAKQNAMRGARKALVTAKEQLRDQVCVPANDYPGKPSDYIVVPNFCVKKKAPGSRQVKVNKDGTISAEATRREIKILETELAKYPSKYADRDIGSIDMEVVIQVFKYMLFKRWRIRFPDPNARFLHVMQQSGLDKGVIPRVTVFALLLEALKET